MVSTNKRAILIISFGTSVKEARQKTIDVFERLVKNTYPHWEVRHAFTSEIIINRLKKEQGIVVDTIEESLNRLKYEGFTHILVQPTHIINGLEHARMLAILQLYQKDFVSIQTGAPLLTSIHDLQVVISGIMENNKETPKDTGFLFLGHGTDSASNTVYSKLENMARQMGYLHLFTGTIKIDSDMDTVLGQISQIGYKKMILQPLLFLSGYHVRNEIAGNAPSSWKSRLNSFGIETTCILKGLGEYTFIQQLLLSHMASAFQKEIDPPI